MKDIKDLCYIIEEEIGKIAEKGLTTGNLETAYKLIDMYKDIKNTKYWETKGEYYMQVLSEMRGGYSESNGYGNGYSERRDSMGRYSRDGGNMNGSSYNGGNSYNNGNSYARGYGNMGGHYSRSNGMDTYGEYMNEKQSYRTGGRSEDCKRRMLDALEEHLDKLTTELGDMSKDADCREERDTINRYMDKLKKMM